MFHANVFRRVQQLSALAAFLCIPLLFSTQTRDQFELPKLIALAIGCVPLVIGRLFDGARRRPTLLEIAFFIWVFVQAATSLPGWSIAWRTSLIGEYENFGGLLTSLALAAWFYGLGRGLPRTDLQRISFFVVTAGFLSALYALAQSLNFDFVVWNPETYNASRVFAGLGNPNFLSAYLAMVLPLHLSFALGSESPSRKRALAPTLAVLLMGAALLLAATGQGAKRLGFSDQDFDFLWIPGLVGLLLLSVGLCHPLFRRGRLAAWGGSLLIGLGLVSTGSRGGWLGALAGLAVFGILRRSAAPPTLGVAVPSPTNRPVWRRSLGIGISALLVVCLLIVGRPFFERLVDSTAHPLESLGRSRLTIWVPAVKMLHDHPWKGIGPDCFKIAFPQYSKFDFTANDGLFVSSRTAHNEWLQAAATSGCPGLLSLVFLVGCFLLFSIRRLRSSTPETRGAYAAILAAGVAYLTQNLFSFGVAAILLLWIFLLAYVNRPLPAGEARPPSSRAWVLALIASAFLAIPITLRLTADLHFARGMHVLDYLRSSTQALDENKKHAYAAYSLAETRRATELFPLDIKYRLYSGMALEQLAESQSENRKDRLQESLAVYRDLTVQSPSNGYYFNNCGRVLMALAHENVSLLPEAEKAQEQAAALSPENPFFLAQWGSLLLLENKTAEAAAPLAKAFSLDPTLSAKTLCQVAMDALLNGQKEGGWRLLDQAVALNPKSAEAWFFRGYFFKRDGRNKEAQAAMEKALAINPNLAGMTSASQDGQAK
jgi:O-antigen ligase/Flp pilus assembly protein TadD